MGKVYRLIRDPFIVISGNKTEFIIWFIFTIFAGQLGIIANVLIKKYSSSASISSSLLIDSLNGSFYTFSIALVASILGPLFLNFINSKKLQFRTIKIFTIIISIFFLFFSGIIYAVLQTQNKNNLSLIHNGIDWTQLLLYIFAIGFVSYGYCILRLEQYPILFSDLDDPLFNQIDDQKVEEVIEEGQELNSDGEGVSL